MPRELCLPASLFLFCIFLGGEKNLGQSGICWQGGFLLQTQGFLQKIVLGTWCYSISDKNDLVERKAEDEEKILQGNKV